MSKFTTAVLNQEARTENGMKARQTTANANVDLFFKIGASRGKDIIPGFVAAFAENKDYALRIAQWARDVRGGSGERQIFRDILQYLAKTADRKLVLAVLKKTPELGRWDDVLTLMNTDYRADVCKLVVAALKNKNGLCAKWMPRKGADAYYLRKALKLTPKQYRKLLVRLTKVVESLMCANQWDAINFNSVPSVASARYKKAFGRHTENYGKWAEKLAKGDKTAKVNAGAVYPYDVIKGLSRWNPSDREVVKAQWAALPNYVGDASILPLVDVSGSMACATLGGNSSLTALDVAVSLGLYLAEKNTGDFKDTFLTFSNRPQLLHLKGDVIQKLEQMRQSKWEMNTDLHLAFDKILETAVAGKVSQDDMPKVLLILSDMQFDACTKHDDSALEMIKRKYAAAGYTVPSVVFWNLNAHENVPVKFDTTGTALVSGFSPSIMKAVLKADLSGMTPEAVMLQTIMNKKYDLKAFKTPVKHVVRKTAKSARRRKKG